MSSTNPEIQSLATTEVIDRRLTLLHTRYEEAKKPRAKLKLREKIDALLECRSAVSEGIEVDANMIGMAVSAPNTVIQAITSARKLNAQPIDASDEKEVHTGI